MRRVVSLHPALSTVFLDAEDPSKKPYYARLPQVNLNDCVVFETKKHHQPPEASTDEDTELDALLETQHNTRFDAHWGTLPLWRLVILHTPGDNSRFVASFVYQHAIGDGNAGPVFHRTFLAALRAISAEHGGDELGPLNPDPDPVLPAPETPLPPSLESLHPLPLSLPYLLKMAWYDKFPSSGPELWLGARVGPPSRSRFRSFSLGAESTAGFLGVCRAQGVSMTAAVHALIARAIFVNLPADKTRLKSSIAINLRRFLPEGALAREDVGNYVSATYLEHARGGAAAGGGGWEEARRVKGVLESEVRMGGRNASTGCLRWVGDMHEYFAVKFGQPRDATFCLTNLGSFGVDEGGDGSWRIGRMVFSEGFDAAREAMDVTMVSGADGCLTVGLVWGDGVVEEALILKIFETLKTLVVTTADTGKG